MKATRKDIQNTSRLTVQAAFDSLRKTKSRWVSKGFALQAAPSSRAADTVGFCVIASKKTAKGAVERNRMRRRLNALALEILPTYARYDMDYMIVTRREAMTLSPDEMRRDMIWCLKRLNLLKNDVS